LFNTLFAALVPNEVFLAVYDDKDADVAAGADVARVFAAAADAREMASNSTCKTGTTQPTW
jgi:glucose/mannose transport system substrate-binding protein